MVSMLLHMGQTRERRGVFLILDERGSGPVDGGGGRGKHTKQHFACFSSLSVFSETALKI